MGKSRPTDAELAILTVLWERGSATVREVSEALAATRKSGYTTILKLMQIMTDKGLVKRDDSARTHVYRAAVRRTPTQRRLVSDLIDRAFGGSATELAMRALAAKRATADELAAVRALLDELEEKDS